MPIVSDNSQQIAQCLGVPKSKALILLFLLNMYGVLAESRAKLFDLQLFPAGLLTHGVVVIASLLAYEVHDFQLPLAFTFCHGQNSKSKLSFERGIVANLPAEGNG